MAITMPLMMQSCFIVKKIAGADIDHEQFAKAREAKMHEIRLEAGNDILKRLNNGDPIENADISFYLSQNFLNKIAHQYDSSKGFLDQSTTYIIKSVSLSLKNGAAILSLNMTAHNSEHNVDVDIATDCLLSLKVSNNELVTQLEPFNIAPTTTSRGILASADELINNLIKINLANLGKTMPQIKIPLDITNNMTIAGTKTQIKDKINLIIKSPTRIIDYKLKLKEVLIFENKAFVALNIDKVEIK